MAYTQDDANQLFNDAMGAGWAPKQIYQGAQQLGIDNDQLAGAWNLWNTKQGVDAPAVTGQQVQDYALQQGFDTSRPATADGYSQAQANQLFNDAVQSGWKPQDIYQGAAKLGISNDQLAGAWNAFNQQQGNNNKPISGQQVYNYASQQGYTPQTYEQNVGNSYTGLGITQTTPYYFLPQEVRDQIKNQGQANHYAYLDPTGQNSFTVGQLLDKRKADPAAIAANNQAFQSQSVMQNRDGGGGDAPVNYIDPNQELYLWSPGAATRQGHDGITSISQPEYVTKDEFLKRVGTTNLNARVAMVDDTSPASLQQLGIQDAQDYAANLQRGGKPAIRGVGDVFDAAVDPNLKGYVQLGDGGTLFDDIPPVLDKIYQQAGIQDDPAKQEQLKKQLFRYDPRFGVLMDSRLLEPVLAQSGSSGSQGGFFYKNMGALAMAALTVVTAGAATPAMAAALNAGFAGLSAAGNGGSFKDIIKAAGTSYLGSEFGAALGGMANDATANLLKDTALAGSSTANAAVSGFIKGVGSGAAGQLLKTGTIDPGQLALQGLGGGVSSAVSQGVTGAIGDSVNSKLATSIGNTAGKVASSAITGAKLDPIATGMGLLPGIAKEAGNLYKSSGGWT